MQGHILPGAPSGHERRQSELATLVERHTRRDGLYPTPIAPLRLFRSSTLREPVHDVFEPALCLIAQGSKQVMLAKELYLYAPGYYLLVSADLPVIAQVTEATPQTPYLSIRLALDPRQISALLMEADPPIAPGGSVSARGMFVGCFDSLLLDAVTRLLRLLETPQHIAVLAPLVVREILYLLLIGEGGESLRRMALASGERQGIIKALHWLKCNFTEPLRIEALAHEAHMSPSALHHHFKTVTAMTPLQYHKRLRLHEARRLMLGGGVDVGRAGFQVGYESQSQFTREYRRLFGESPRRDMARLRDTPPYHGQG